MYYALRPKRYIPFVLIGLMVTGFLYARAPQKERLEIPVQSGIKAAPSSSSFDELSLEARAVYVWDMNENVALYAHNAEAQLPLASLTKIMTALVALDHASGDSVITLRNEFLNTEGDNGLLAGERWRLKDIVDFTLIVSSNDGAGALASVIASSGESNRGTFAPDSFVALMNAKARELGLSQTYFVNETGLDHARGLAGGYGSAHDVALLFGHALRAMPEQLEATRYNKLRVRSADNILHTAINTDPLVQTIPGIIASKTGFTDLAGGNLVVAFDAGLAKPMVIALLGSSQKGRFRDMEKLVAATLASLQ